MIEITKPSVELIKENDMLKLIEKAGRTCYKSEDKITDDSAERFVKMICRNHHTSVLEHGTVYLKFPQHYDNVSEDESAAIKYIVDSKYSYINNEFITTNFRVLMSYFNDDFDSAIAFYNKFNNETCDHEKRYAFRIICDRGVSHELVRHRVFSFSQESTRYVNYNNKGFKIIQPEWWDRGGDAEREIFCKACEDASNIYQKLCELGQTPQQARAVLPNALKTEIVMTGTKSQWEQFLILRNSPAAHPDMQIIARIIKNILNSVEN